jgi:hypothetical protein
MCRIPLKCSFQGEFFQITFLFHILETDGQSQPIPEMVSRHLSYCPSVFFLFIYLFLVVLGFELRALCLLGRWSTA